jgi:hypothetical protein
MKVDVSIGELVDKVTILKIKLDKIKSEEKLKNIKKEYDILNDKMESTGVKEDNPDFIELRKVNEALWDIEDKIRIKEMNKEFDDEFIQLARSVYFQNDKRSDIKRNINLTFNSELVEEKEYVDYKNKQ